MDTTLRDIGDDLGPAKILCLRQLKPSFEAFVVIDNLACGPALGGIRMAADVTLAEVLRLARAMTLKNAAAGLPHGGGKAGIVAKPSIPKQEKEMIVRAFAQAIREFTEGRNRVSSHVIDRRANPRQYAGSARPRAERKLYSASCCHRDGQESGVGSADLPEACLTVGGTQRRVTLWTTPSRFRNASSTRV